MSLSIQPATDSLNQISAYAALKTSKTTEVEDAGSLEATQTGANHDIVEISKEGKEQAAILTASKSGGSEDADNEIDTNELLAQLKKEISGTKNLLDQLIDSDDSTDEDSSTDDLSQYSEYELKQMLKAGTITRSEYLAEIERRKGTEEQLHVQQEQQAQEVQQAGAGGLAEAVAAE